LFHRKRRNIYKNGKGQTKRGKSQQKVGYRERLHRSGCGSEKKIILKRGAFLKIVGDGGRKIAVGERQNPVSEEKVLWEKGTKKHAREKGGTQKMGGEGLAPWKQRIYLRGGRLKHKSGGGTHNINAL